MWQKTPELAAYLWLDRWNPLSVRNDVEYATIIVQKNGKYATIGFVRGEQNSAYELLVQLDNLNESGLLPIVKPVGWVHTHSAYGGPNSERFSPGDMGVSEDYGIDAYLGTPKGKFLRYKPGGAPEGLGNLPPSTAYERAHNMVLVPPP